MTGKRGAVTLNDIVLHCGRPQKSSGQQGRVHFTENTSSVTGLLIVAVLEEEKR
jgi:hypothetical protein